MNSLVKDAAWILIISFSISLVYEVCRATVKAGTSRHDSLRKLFTQDFPLYIVAGLVVAILFANYAWSAWVGLIFCVTLILVSIFYYNPKIMLERKPAPIDWFEDLTYTGLLFVAATMLSYEIKYV